MKYFNPMDKFGAYGASVTPDCHVDWLLPKQKINSIIFDLDGVLVPSLEIHQQAFLQAAKDAYIGIKLEEYLDLRKTYVTTEALVKYLDPRIDIKAFQRRKDHYAFNLIETLEPNQALLGKLQQYKSESISLYIATNSSREFTERIVKRVELDKFINNIVTKDDVQARKPDPAVYNKVIKDNNLNTSETIVFEDQFEGIISAERAGIPIQNIIYTTHDVLKFSFAQLDTRL